MDMGGGGKKKARRRRLFRHFSLSARPAPSPGPRTRSASPVHTRTHAHSHVDARAQGEAEGRRGRGAARFSALASAASCFSSVPTPHAQLLPPPLPSQRLMRDFRKLQQDPPAGVNGSPTSDNILRWNAVIFGPEDTPWDGGKKEERGEICARLSLSRHRRPRPHTRPVTHSLHSLRHLQADPGLHGGVPQPPARREVRVPHVPPQHLRGRRHLPGHPAEPVVPHLRRRRRADVHPGERAMGMCA